MTVDTLLTRARTLGATFTLQGDRLKVRATAPLPDDLLTNLREHKPELLAFFKGRVAEVLPGPGGATDHTLAAAYRRYWTLPETEPMETFQAAYSEIVTLESQASPEVAWQTLHETATGYHAETGICPFCREPGSLHLPAKRPGMEM